MAQTDLQSYALFWRARHRLRWSVTPGNSTDDVVLNVIADEVVAGITFEFQRAIASADAGVTVLPSRRTIVFPVLSPGESLTVHIAYSH